MRVPILNFGRGGEHQKNLLNSLQGHHISAWPSVSLLSHFFSVPVFPLSRHIVPIPPSPSQPPAASLFHISLSITLSFCICIFTAFPSFLGAAALSSFLEKKKIIIWWWPLLCLLIQRHSGGWKTKGDVSLVVQTRCRECPLWPLNNGCYPHQQEQKTQRDPDAVVHSITCVNVSRHINSQGWPLPWQRSENPDEGIIRQNRSNSSVIVARQ